MDVLLQLDHVLEQLTCQFARQGSQLHRVEKTTESINVSDGLLRIVTFLLLRLIMTFTYLLTYLFYLPYMTVDRQNADFDFEHYCL